MPDIKTITPDEAVAQLKNLAPFIRSHAARLQEIHEKRVNLIGAEGVVEAIANGATDLSKHGETMAALEREDAMLRASIGPAREAIRRVFPTAYQKIETMQGQLEALHSANQEKLYRFVAKKIEKTFPNWWTPAEIRWMALRSAAFREEAAFESLHQSGANIPLQLGRDANGNTCNVPSDDFMQNPGVVSGIVERLENSLAETQKRQAQLEKSLS